MLPGWSERVPPERLRVVGEPDYEAIFDRAVRRLGPSIDGLESERAAAARLYGRLSRLPAAGRRLLLRNVCVAHGWSLAARLIDRCHHLAFTDGAAAVEHAELAVLVAARLSPDRYGLSLTEEIRARAWAALGNACSVWGPAHTATGAFRRAREHLAAGTGEPLEEALLLDFEASHHAIRGDLQRAGEEVRRALRRFRLVRDEHLEGRSLAKLGALHLLERRESAAGTVLEEAAGRLDAGRDPYTAAVGWALLACVRLRAIPGLPGVAGARQALRPALGAAAQTAARGARPLLRRVEEEVQRLQNRGGEEERRLLLTSWPRWL